MELLETFFNWSVFVDALPLMLRGLGVTVMLGVVSIILGLVGGLVLAMLRLYGYAPVRFLARVYIDVLRSIPLLVLLVLIYYALPFVGIRLSSFAAATAALSLVSCAYSAEIFRSGIEAIPRGQFEASASQGMSFFNTMRDIILPQAMRIVMPPMTSNCINVMKDTALASVVAMPDLLSGGALGPGDHRTASLLTFIEPFYACTPNPGRAACRHRRTSGTPDRAAA
jgi:polar amino acid transport system permease protein